MSACETNIKNSLIAKATQFFKENNSEITVMPISRIQEQENIKTKLNNEFINLFEENPKLVNAVYEALGLNNINESEITYTDEEGNLCAKMGGKSSKFTKGSKWEIVKDLKGYPSHAQGGVDIKLGKNGFSFTRNNSVIEAKHGLVLPEMMKLGGYLAKGGPLDGDPKKKFVPISQEEALDDGLKTGYKVVQSIPTYIKMTDAQRREQEFEENIDRLNKASEEHRLASAHTDQDRVDQWEQIIADRFARTSIPNSFSFFNDMSRDDFFKFQELSSEDRDEYIRDWSLSQAAVGRGSKNPKLNQLLTSLTPVVGDIQDLKYFDPTDPVDYAAYAAGFLLPGTPSFFKKAFKNVVKSGKNLIKPVSKVVDKVDDITENLKHLEYAKNYYSKYGYNIPENLAEIAKNSKLTDETIQGLVNQHNTFVRGVSTNWDEIAKKNPEILRHLEGKGIDYINNPQAAAEYMSTHVPIKTGYGRASLNETVFKEGKDAIYTSNSIPTAEGYTYGDGYIVKIKRPTDFSSKNRIDWIENNKLDYFEDVIPVLKTQKRRGLLQKKHLDDSKNILKTEHLKGVENRNYVLNNQLNNYIKEKGVNRISINGEYSFPGGKATGDIIFDDVSNIQRRISNKYIDEELRLASIGKFDEAAKLHLNKEKEIYDEIMNYMKNYPDFDPVNRYAHYLHIGTPGQKLLEPIEAIRITPDIWKNKSRAHTNVFSKGLSAGSLIPFYLYSQSQNQNKNKE